MSKKYHPRGAPISHPSGAGGTGGGGQPPRKPTDGHGSCGHKANKPCNRCGRHDKHSEPCKRLCQHCMTYNHIGLPCTSPKSYVNQNMTGSRSKGPAKHKLSEEFQRVSNRIVSMWYAMLHQRNKSNRQLGALVARRGRPASGRPFAPRPHATYPTAANTTREGYLFGDQTPRVRLPPASAYQQPAGAPAPNPAQGNGRNLGTPNNTGPHGNNGGHQASQGSGRGKRARSGEPEDGPVTKKHKDSKE